MSDSPDVLTLKIKHLEEEIIEMKNRENIRDKKVDALDSAWSRGRGAFWVLGILGTIVGIGITFIDKIQKALS